MIKIASLDQIYSLLGMEQKVATSVGISTSPFWSLGIWIAYGLLFAGIFILLFYILYRNQKYTIDVTILEIVGEKRQVIRRFDRATISHGRDGKEKFRLMKRKKVRLPPPSQDDYTLSIKRKFFGLIPRIVKSIDLIHYGSSDYDYLPLGLKLGEKLKDTKFLVLPYANLSWAINEIQADASKFAQVNEQIQKYLLPVSLIFIILLVFIVSWFIMGNIRQMIEVGSQIAANCNVGG